MRRWLRLWAGHLTLGGVVVAGLFMLMFIRNSMAAYDFQSMWWNFVCSVLLFLIAILLGAVSAWLWQDGRERYYLRRLWREEDTNPPGGVVDTGDAFAPAYGAHSAGEGVSSDGE